MIELSFSFESDSEDEQVFLQVYRSFVGNWKIKEILIAFCFKKNLRYCGLLDEVIYYYYYYFSEVERTGKIVIKSYKQGDSRELPIIPAETITGKSSRRRQSKGCRGTW